MRAKVLLRNWLLWWSLELGLTSGVAPVGGIVVTVSLFAVSMAAVFRTDQISFLEGRAAKPIDDT